MKGEKYGAIWVAWYWGFTTLPPSLGQMYTRAMGMNGIQMHTNGSLQPAKSESSNIRCVGMSRNIGSCWDESIQCTIEAHMAECSPKLLSWIPHGKALISSNVIEVLPQHSGIQFSRASVVFYCPHKWQWLIIYSNWLILQWLWEAGSTLVHLIFTYPSTEWDGRDLENQHIEFCTGKSLQFALSMLAASLDQRMFFYPMA